MVTTQTLGRLARGLEADQYTGQMEEPEQDIAAPLVATCRRRQPTSHASERSTTDRWRPSRSLDSMLRRAIRGVMPRWRGTRRQRG
jgi:hypothetical protein